NPAAYIAETLETIIDGHPHSRIEDLMPWRFRKNVKPASIGLRLSAYYQLPNRSTVPTEAESSISEELTAASERNGKHPLTAANLDHFKALRAMAAVDSRFPVGSTKIGDH
ncbi:transposase domain-containing protein, partial [Bradyrhizobium sp. 166]|nr:transposase domain-containing protein [Bradyrhizobium sp. 166]